MLRHSAERTIHPGPIRLTGFSLYTLRSVIPMREGTDSHRWPFRCRRYAHFLRLVLCRAIKAYPTTDNARYVTLLCSWHQVARACLNPARLTRCENHAFTLNTAVD